MSFISTQCITLVAVAAPFVPSLSQAVSAQPSEAPTAVLPRPTSIWLVAQTVPSPEWIGGDGQHHVGFRWQITPVLFSTGIHRGLMPWRFLVVEPLVRHNGSLELFLSPEYVAGGEGSNQSWILRGGMRSYFPLAEHGELLSCSLGTSYFRYDSRSGAAYEAGIYTMFGTLGLQLTWSPSDLPIQWIGTVQLRYF